MRPLFTDHRPDPTQEVIKSSEIAGFVFIGLLAAGLLFLLAIATTRSLSSRGSTFTCVPNYNGCTSSECEVHSLSCQQSEAGGYPDSSCSNECENSFACMDTGCELVGPGRGDYADLTCDSSCS
jgi:hypothetical protein